MEGKQAAGGKPWDDKRFDGMAKALGRVKVPRVKKPEVEETKVDMSKQSCARLGTALAKQAGCGSKKKSKKKSKKL